MFLKAFGFGILPNLQPWCFPTTLRELSCPPSCSQLCNWSWLQLPAQASALRRQAIPVLLPCPAARVPTLPQLCLAASGGLKKQFSELSKIGIKISL
jgi:hypothetical protein